jgi:hypothetical protein
MESIRGEWREDGDEIGDEREHEICRGSKKRYLHAVA